jgi:hypothetical protein
MATKDIVDVVSKIITALATILGGAWAYYRFVKGRVFQPRLTLTAKARQLQIRTTEYVLLTIELSNVGLSRIDLDSTTLRVCSLVGNAVAKTVSVPRRVRLRTCRVLLAHSWIESGEVLNEQNLLILPPNHNSPILIDFRVVVQGVSLTATAIAESAHADALRAGERSSL